MEIVQLAKNVDLNKIVYSAQKTLESGGKNVYMSVDGKSITIQTPRMLCQWGLSKYNPDNKIGSEKYSIDMSFKGMDGKAGLKAFHDKLVELDNKVVEDVVKNSKDWLRKANMTKEVVEALSTPSVKYAKDKETGEITDKYPPSFRINVPVKDGRTMCEVFDNNRQKINIFDVETKGANVTAIIKLQGIWFAGGKFGCTWRMEQLRVEPPETIKGFAFKPDDDDNLVDSDEEINVGENAVETSDDEDDEKPVPTKETPATTVIEDSDDDDAIEKPKVVKSVVAKKKAVK